jgi:hypothetical protein
MAITENKYTGNGSTVLYSFTFPYLEVADIKVSLDGTLTTAYTLANATTVQFNTAPANGVAIRLFRQTNDDALNAQFFPGSAIRSTDLNNNFTQNLYVTQESNRDATQGITTADAATATANTALSNSSAAVSTANTASSNASAAVSTANTASSNASAAVSTANTASSNATTAVSTANAATATANSAASDAATAISTANSAVSTANTASTAATNAVNTANSASSAASSAVSTANTASSNASAAVSTANTASSNATSAVNTANSALSTANAAASAVANAILYDIVANVAAIPASPANNDAVEVTDSTGIESFTPLTSIPGGFAGNSGLSVRIVYTTTGNTWTWIQYFPNDPETRYLKEAVTTSDTAPVSPSDGDLWYDSVGGRTYVYYDDGDTSQWVDTSPQGSGVSDAISEGNTSAEVIDTGSDGRFVVTTEGSERLRVNSSGNLGLGTASPTDTGGYGRALDIQSNTGAAIYLRTNDDTSQIAQGSSDLTIRTRQAHPIIFNTNNTERLRITSAGLVGIGTSSPSAELSIAGSDPQLVLWEGSDGASSSKVQLGTGLVQGFINIHKGDGTRTVQISSDDTSYFIGGNVGIGTASPTYLCNVIAAAGSQNIFQAGQTGVSNGYTITSNGTNLTHAWFNGGSEAARIDSSGRLGIGTSSPGAAIHVTSSNAGGYGGVIYNTSSTGEGLIIRAGSTSSHNILVAQTYDGSASRFIVNAAGNVGIGTTSPRRTLEVSGADGYLCLNATNTSTGTSQLLFGDTDDDNIGRIYYDHTDNNMAFWTDTSEKARIDSNGRVLVGTSTSLDTSYGTPGGYLQINNAPLPVILAAYTNDIYGGRLDFVKSRSTAVNGKTIVQNNDGLGNVIWGGADGTNIIPAATIGCAVDGTPGTNDMPGRLVFSTTADGASSPTERMRIHSNGFTTFATSNTSQSVGTGVKLTPNGGVYTVVSSGDSFTHHSGSAYKFYVGNDGSIASTSSTISVISDQRFKENIRDLDDGLNKVLALQPRKFDWKEGKGSGTKNERGFIAQEFEQVFPDLINEWKDPAPEGEDPYKSVRADLIPVLVKAIQEQQAIIETLEATIASLEARLTALEGGTN